MIENYLDDILLELFASPIISSFKIIKREIGDERKDYLLCSYES